jgi:signal transduction histidine kinase
MALSGYFILQKIEINNHKTMLLNMIDQFIVSDGDIQKRIKSIKDKSNIRVTIISNNGEVLLESDRDVNGMENHKNRPEIVEALENGSGSCVRYSSSVGTDFLYVTKYYDGIFIRMAYSLKSIRDKFFNFWLKAIGLFGFALGVSFIVAMRINKKISSDLIQIDNSLTNLLDKKYKISFDGVICCKEFETILKQIKKVSNKLEKREKQKSKYTKKLKNLTQKQSDIISAISHEFKNPVAAILGYTQTIKDDPDLSPDMRDKFLSKVLKNGEKINDMIDRLSMAIKLENDNSLPEFSEFRVDLMVHDIRDNLLQKYKDREIVVDMEEIKIKADQAMFDNLITNLVENALKYSQDTVLIRCKNGVFEVKDQGIGIAKKDIDSITKKFVRVDNLSWDNSIGVGLYLVKYILKLHNIDLMIDSKLNKGSRFWFDLSGVR